MRLAKDRENFLLLWSFPNYHRVFVSSFVVKVAKRLIESTIFLGRRPNTRTPTIAIVSQDRREINLVRDFEPLEYSKAKAFVAKLEETGKMKLDDLEILGFTKNKGIRN